MQPNKRLLGSVLSCQNSGKTNSCGISYYFVLLPSDKNLRFNTSDDLVVCSSMKV